VHHEVFEIRWTDEFCRFETIKRIYLSLDAFTVDNGTMTPTMKIRRKDAYNKFKKELDELYSLGEPDSFKL
jgi:Long-chain acyl-CoA synthetases (AMP-forming)